MKRNYVILVMGADGRWKQFTAIYARSKRAALYQATTGENHTTGTFRVVPARAWGREYTL